MQKATLKSMSLLLIILSFTMMISWLFKLNLIVVTSLNHQPIMFNSALCFFLLGIALFFSFPPTLVRKQIQMIVAGLVVVIAGLSFIENIFEVNLGIDTLFFLSWYDSSSIHPSRMAINTSFTFLCTAMLLVFMQFAQKKAVAACIEVLIFVVFIVGLLSTCGYFFNFNFLYSWNKFAYMSFLSSILFVFTAICFWLQWWMNPNSASWYAGHEDKKILFVSSIILLTIALLSGLTGFVSAIKQQDSAMGVTFQQILKDKANFFESDITQGSHELNYIISNLYFQKILGNEAHSPIDGLDSVLALFLSEGFSAVELLDANYKVLARKGKFVQNPEFSIPLKMTQKKSLLNWKQAWYLEILQSIDPVDKTKGFVRVQWPMNAIDHFSLGELSSSKTVSFLICTPVDVYYAKCFPSDNGRKSFQTLRKIDARNFPIDLALKGQSGLTRTFDFNHTQVLAAYQPLGATGLGAVLQMNLSELYKSVFKSLEIIIPFIIVAILLGILFLRLAVLPLLRKVINTEAELIKSNKLLTESQDRYDIAVLGSRVGLWDWQISDDSFYSSSILQEMVGETENEIGATFPLFMERLHPDDYQRIKNAFENHLKNRTPFNVEFRLKKTSGEYFWVQAIGQAIWSENGLPKRMAGSIFDISDRKKNQREQATLYTITEIMSEAIQFDVAIPKILRAICEGLNWDFGGLWMVYAKENLIRNVSVWSRAGQKLEEFKNITSKMQYSMGEGIPGVVWQTAKPYNISNLEKHTDSTHSRFQKMTEASLLSAFAFPILLGYKVIGVIEFFTMEKQVLNDAVLKLIETIGPQLSQFILRKSIENDLRESEAYKTAIVEYASDSIITIDDHGAIISCNAQTEQLFGYPIDELVNKNINELMPALISRIKRKLSNVSIETTAVCSNGAELTVEISLSEVTVNNSHRYVAIIRNVTERKKMEAFKSEFISIVSHELRTPLTSIRGALGLILGGAAGDFSDKASRMLQIANNNCSRLLLLINDILDLEKIEAGKMAFELKFLDINEIVNEAITVNQSYADKFAVKLKALVYPTPIIVNADPDRLMQVLTNLISNAVKFSPTDGSVCVEIKLQDKSVLIEVIDQGAGIPEEFKSRIFQKFSQADSSSTRGKGGTGLGLSISKAIIEKLNGKLNFESEFGDGSTFYIELPVEENQQLESTVEPEVSKIEHWVLVCEDDPEQADHLSHLLLSEGFQVDVANDAASAKKFLAEKKYDVLLLDILLPDEDGITLIRELRAVEVTRDLPIVVISVVCESGKSMLQGDAVAIVDWMDKPVDFAKLVHIIQSIELPAGHALPHLLHIEDDQDVRVIVSEILKDVAKISVASTLSETKEKLAHTQFDLVILDLMLLDGNGTELLPLLAKKRLPVVIFSSSELDENFAHYVSQTLLKSKTTNQKLLNMVKQLLSKGHAKEM